MLIHLSPINPIADYPRLAELLRASAPEPVALRRLRQFRAGSASRRIHLQVAAYDSDGRIAGYAEVLHDAATMPASRFRLDVVVDASRQGQGIGGMLYDDALEFAREQGARSLVVEVSDRSPASVRFALRRGFSVELHVCDAAAEAGPFEGYYDSPASASSGYYVLVKAA